MVSVHNSSLFDELREDAMSNLPDNGNNEPLYDELDDQFEEDLNIQSPRMNRLNMQKMQSSASNYFANKTSPQSNNRSPSVDNGLLDSARSTKSISSVVSQRHHGRLFFPDKRHKNNTKSNNTSKSNKISPRAKNLDDEISSSNITNGTQRIRQRVVEGQELINRRRQAANSNNNNNNNNKLQNNIIKKPKSPLRDTSPIAVRKSGIVINHTRPSPPKSWDTTKPLDYSPQPIKRLPVPKQVHILSKEEKIFKKARERTIRTQNVNRRRKEIEDKKMKDTEKVVKKRFQKHEERVNSRKEYEAVERRRRLKDREDRAMSNMESYFAQRNDKALTAALKQKMGRRSRANHSNRYGNGGSRVYDDSDAQSRHTMHTLAKKKLALLEQDRLDKLLRRVEEQDRRIEKLEKEKAMARRRQADLRAREGREIGYRAQWARRNRGGLRTAGASSINKYGGRAPSAMSTRSDQAYGRRNNNRNGTNDIGSYANNHSRRRDVTSSMSLPMSAPNPNQKNKTLHGDDNNNNNGEGVIIKRKDSKWFLEEDENDGVTDDEVVEDPSEFYHRQQQQQQGIRQQQYRVDEDNVSQTTTSTQDNMNYNNSNNNNYRSFDDQSITSSSANNNSVANGGEYDNNNNNNDNNNAIRNMDQLSDSLDGLSQQGDCNNRNIDLSHEQQNQILNQQNLEQVQLQQQQQQQQQEYAMSKNTIVNNGNGNGNNNNNNIGIDDNIGGGNTMNSKITNADNNNIASKKPTTKKKMQRSKRAAKKNNNLSISTSNDDNQLTFEDRQQIVQQQQQQQANLIPYGGEAWYYIDVQGIAQGPFTDHQMLSWHGGNFFTADLRMRRGLNTNTTFQPMGDLFPEFDKAFQEGQGPCPAIQHTSRQYTGRF